MSEDAFIGPLRLGPRLLAHGRPDGPLSGVTLAVKDVIDVAGIPTGAGNPAFLADAPPAPRHAVAVARLLDAGADVIGKAHTDELAFSLSGTNAHYGTPRNPRAPGRIPGGSSSGSASAVAGGVAAIALGTDTAGSIRVPASYCGVWGLRPTHGRVPLEGVLPLAPSFDTCGLLAASGDLLERAGQYLLAAAPGAPGTPSVSTPPTALVLATDLLAAADPEVAVAVAVAAERLAADLGVPLTRAPLAGARLDGWLDAFRGRQFVEAWRAHGAWIEARQPPMGPGVGARFATARTTPSSAAEAAGPAGVEVRAALDRLLPPGGALVLPAAATVAPVPDLDMAAKEALRSATARLTAIAGLAGAPAISLPLAVVDGRPVGVSLLARPGEDERLLAAASRRGAPV
jgi:amidase